MQNATEQVTLSQMGLPGAAAVAERVAEPTRAEREMVEAANRERERAEALGWREPAGGAAVRPMTEQEMTAKLAELREKNRAETARAAEPDAVRGVPNRAASQKGGPMPNDLDRARERAEAERLRQTVLDAPSQSILTVESQRPGEPAVLSDAERDEVVDRMRAGPGVTVSVHQHVPVIPQRLSARGVMLRHAAFLREQAEAYERLAAIPAAADMGSPEELLLWELACKGTRMPR